MKHFVNRFAGPMTRCCVPVIVLAMLLIPAEHLNAAGGGGSRALRGTAFYCPRDARAALKEIEGVKVAKHWIVQDDEEEFDERTSYAPEGVTVFGFRALYLEVQTYESVDGDKIGIRGVVQGKSDVVRAVVLAQFHARTCDDESVKLGCGLHFLGAASSVAPEKADRHVWVKPVASNETLFSCVYYSK